jgi:hypothetical protein
VDYTDQHGQLHFFYLRNATFVRGKIVKTTGSYVDAIYSIQASQIGSYTSSVPGEYLFWINVLPIRSTLTQLPDGTYTGSFQQNGKVYGKFVGG